MQEAELKVIGGQQLVDFYNNNNIDFDTLKDMALKGYTIEKNRIKSEVKLMNIEDVKRAISKNKSQVDDVVLYLKGELVVVKSEEVIPKLLEEYRIKQ
jgi:hypothetical protein